FRIATARRARRIAACGAAPDCGCGASRDPAHRGVDSSFPSPGQLLETDRDEELGELVEAGLHDERVATGGDGCVFEAIEAGIRHDEWRRRDGLDDRRSLRALDAG